MICVDREVVAIADRASERIAQELLGEALDEDRLVGEQRRLEFLDAGECASVGQRAADIQRRASRESPCMPSPFWRSRHMPMAS